MAFLVFPYWVSDRILQAADIGLYALGTVSAHLVGDMAISIQGNRRSAVAEIFLGGFDITPSLERRNYVDMSQIVKTGIRTRITIL